MTETNYPGIYLRIKAIVIDSIVILFLIILTTYILSLFTNVPNSVRIIAFVFIFILYDPIFTNSFGGTIGHMFVGIRVKQALNESKNIPLHLAFIRYIVKKHL